MWLLVKVYLLAFSGDKTVNGEVRKESKMCVLVFLLFSAKYKFASVVFNFNDAVMQLIALISLYFHLKQNLALSIFFMGFAASVKMSALLYLPGCLLISAFEYGILGAVTYFIGIFLVQLLFGLEFILKNAPGYWEMAYDFKRKFD
mmetsp:Transcript_2963/g.5011  ORF Transcript_2963/g.5011 Transcript_2963/m.5011 type:complete len:146 (+) Transcript_2963:327-764(+)|eukprot:CAMPEP_0168621562 /NCGR_PEP_ID=MMETSP0449_2-20121227/7764_1 /TAXON_ID=1082188 /ORGANISM="Strombidium rassoulzadegani, Strain ras09" /LENGTH=145 /DNA_ID=CAMNT_0008662697 /DNA_START=195 /DNA_END=632 /DNA_ORIENTATION=-